MFPLVSRLLKDDAGVAAICAGRVYRHGSAPQNVVAPYVTWFIVSSVAENALGERPRVDTYQVQVDCWSSNTGTGDSQAEQLAEAVRDALEGVADMVGVVANGKDFETQRFRVGMTFTFWTHRPALSS